MTNIEILVKLMPVGTNQRLRKIVERGLEQSLQNEDYALAKQLVDIKAALTGVKDDANA